jgi:hypothetical protein
MEHRAYLLDTKAMRVDGVNLGALNDPNALLVNLAVGIINSIPTLY